MKKPSDLVQGTLDLFILTTDSLEPKHGWGVARRIRQISGEVLQAQQASQLSDVINLVIQGS